MRGRCAGDEGIPEKFRTATSFPRPEFPNRGYHEQDESKVLAKRIKPLHRHAVRGSPLLRFLFLTLALAATCLGLMRVTSTGKMPSETQPPPTPRETESSITPFQLTLSSPPSLVEIDTGKIFRPALTDTAPLSGTLELDPKNPRVGLIVKWKNPTPPGEHRFAKLTLEAPGQNTISHTFDGTGDLDGFIELPLPTTP
jgi:hypothetical protein